MKPKVNPIVLVSVVVIILLAAFVLGWRYFYPEAASPIRSQEVIPVRVTAGRP
jgi:hypothetical protein